MENKGLLYLLPCIALENYHGQARLNSNLSLVAKCHIPIQNIMKWKHQQTHLKARQAENMAGHYHRNLSVSHYVLDKDYVRG